MRFGMDVISSFLSLFFIETGVVVRTYGDVGLKSYSCGTG